MTKKLRNTLLTLAALVLASGALAEHNHQPARPEDNCIVDLATNEVHCPETLPTTRERRRVPEDNTPGAVPDLLQIIDGFAKKKRKADARPDYEKLYVELVAALCAENLKYPRRMLFDGSFLGATGLFRG